MPLLIILAALSLPIYAEHLTPRDYAITAQIETGVPMLITLAVVAHESGGNLAHKPIKCNNGTYDLGAGFNSRWIGWYAARFNSGKPIRYKHAESIVIVARALAWNLDTFGNWPEALTAYRRGQTWTRRHGVDKYYVGKVLEILADYYALRVR
jgi:hypothetical protein